MIEMLHMDWPFAVVCVAAIIAIVVVYGIRRAVAAEERTRISYDPEVARLPDKRHQEYE